jgi:hypothetical protein
MGYGGLNVSPINLSTDSPSWSYDVMLVWHLVTASVIIITNPALLLAQLKLHSLSPYD